MTKQYKNTGEFLHLQPVATLGRHGAISSNHSEAW